jgi:hypothetical protein
MKPFEWEPSTGLVSLAYGEPKASKLRRQVEYPRGGSNNDLTTFNDAVVAFRAGAECLKRLLVSLAFVRHQRDDITVEFDNDSPLLHFGFVGLHLARGPGQKATAE